MDRELEVQRIGAELQQIQDEIDRRKTRVDAGTERFHNLEKIDELRRRKNELDERLQTLKS